MTKTDLFITNYIADGIKLKQAILYDGSVIDVVRNAAFATVEAIRNEKKILIVGNGGSAADAQHVAGEFVSKFNFDRPGLPAIALTTDTSVLTAIGNDYGYEKVFERQIYVLGNPGDILFAFTTSGRSKNILNGIAAAQKNGMKTVLFTGVDTKLQDICDFCINVPSEITSCIQEIHITLAHIICAIVEEEIFGEKQ